MKRMKNLNIYDVEWNEFCKYNSLDSVDNSDQGSHYFADKNFIKNLESKSNFFNLNKFVNSFTSNSFNEFDEFDEGCIDNETNIYRIKNINFNFYFMNTYHLNYNTYNFEVNYFISNFNNLIKLTTNNSLISNNLESWALNNKILIYRFKNLVPNYINKLNIDFLVRTAVNSNFLYNLNTYNFKIISNNIRLYFNSNSLYRKKLKIKRSGIYKVINNFRKNYNFITNKGIEELKNTDKVNSLFFKNLNGIGLKNKFIKQLKTKYKFSKMFKNKEKQLKFISVTRNLSKKTNLLGINLKRYNKTLLNLKKNKWILNKKNIKEKRELKKIIKNRLKIYKIFRKKLYILGNLGYKINHENFYKYTVSYFNINKYNVISKTNFDFKNISNNNNLNLLNTVFEDDTDNKLKYKKTKLKSLFWLFYNKFSIFKKSDKSYRKFFTFTKFKKNQYGGWRYHKKLFNNKKFLFKERYKFLKTKRLNKRFTKNLYLDNFFFFKKPKEFVTFFKDKLNWRRKWKQRSGGSRHKPNFWYKNMKTWYKIKSTGNLQIVKYSLSKNYLLNTNNVKLNSKNYNSVNNYIQLKNNKTKLKILNKNLLKNEVFKNIYINHQPLDSFNIFSSFFRENFSNIKVFELYTGKIFNGFKILKLDFWRFTLKKNIKNTIKRRNYIDEDTFSFRYSKKFFKSNYRRRLNMKGFLKRHIDNRWNYNNRFIPTKYENSLEQFKVRKKRRIKFINTKAKKRRMSNNIRLGRALLNGDRIRTLKSKSLNYIIFPDISFFYKKIWQRRYKAARRLFLEINLNYNIISNKLHYEYSFAKLKFLTLIRKNENKNTSNLIINNKRLGSCLKYNYFKNNNNLEFKYFNYGIKKTKMKYFKLLKYKKIKRYMSYFIYKKIFNSRRYLRTERNLAWSLFSKYVSKFYFYKKKFKIKQVMFNFFNNKDFKKITNFKNNNFKNNKNYNYENNAKYSTILTNLDNNLLLYLLSKKFKQKTQSNNFNKVLNELSKKVINSNQYSNNYAIMNKKNIIQSKIFFNFLVKYGKINSVNLEILTNFTTVKLKNFSYKNNLKILSKFKKYYENIYKTKLSVIKNYKLSSFSKILYKTTDLKFRNYSLKDLNNNLKKLYKKYFKYRINTKDVNGSRVIKNFIKSITVFKNIFKYLSKTYILNEVNDDEDKLLYYQNIYKFSSNKLKVKNTKRFNLKYSLKKYNYLLSLTLNKNKNYSLNYKNIYIRNKSNIRHRRFKKFLLKNKIRLKKINLKFSKFHNFMVYFNLHRLSKLVKYKRNKIYLSSCKLDLNWFDFFKIPVDLTYTQYNIKNNFKKENVELPSFDINCDTNRSALKSISYITSTKLKCILRMNKRIRRKSEYYNGYTELYDDLYFKDGVNFFNERSKPVYIKNHRAFLNNLSYRKIIKIFKKKPVIYGIKKKKPSFISPYLNYLNSYYKFKYIKNYTRSNDRNVSYNRSNDRNVSYNRSNDRNVSYNRSNDRNVSYNRSNDRNVSYNRSNDRNVSYNRSNDRNVSYNRSNDRNVSYNRSNDRNVSYNRSNDRNVSYNRSNDRNVSYNRSNDRNVSYNRSNDRNVSYNRSNDRNVSYNRSNDRNVSYNRSNDRNVSYNRSNDRNVSYNRSNDRNVSYNRSNDRNVSYNRSNDRNVSYNRSNDRNVSYNRSNDRNVSYNRSNDRNVSYNRSNDRNVSYNRSNDRNVSYNRSNDRNVSYNRSNDRNVSYNRSNDRNVSYNRSNDRNVSYNRSNDRNVSYNRSNDRNVSYNRSNDRNVSYNRSNDRNVSYNRSNDRNVSYNRSNYRNVSYNRSNDRNVSYNRSNYRNVSYNRSNYRNVSYNRSNYRNVSYNRSNDRNVSYNRSNYRNVSYNRSNYRNVSYRKRTVITNFKSKLKKLLINIKSKITCFGYLNFFKNIYINTLDRYRASENSAGIRFNRGFDFVLNYSNLIYTKKPNNKKIISTTFNVNLLKKYQIRLLNINRKKYKYDRYKDNVYKLNWYDFKKFFKKRWLRNKFMKKKVFIFLNQNNKLKIKNNIKKINKLQYKNIKKLFLSSVYFKNLFLFVKNRYKFLNSYKIKKLLTTIVRKFYMYNKLTKFLNSNLNQFILKNFKKFINNKSVGLIPSLINKRYYKYFKNSKLSIELRTYNLCKKYKTLNLFFIKTRGYFFNKKIFKIFKSQKKQESINVVQTELMYHINNYESFSKKLYNTELITMYSYKLFLNTIFTYPSSLMLSSRVYNSYNKYLKYVNDGLKRDVKVWSIYPSDRSPEPDFFFFNHLITSFIETKTSHNANLSLHFNDYELIPLEYRIILNLWTRRVQRFHYIFKWTIRLKIIMKLLYLVTSEKDLHLLMKIITKITPKIQYRSHRRFFKFIIFIFRAFFVFLFLKFNVKGIQFEFAGKISVTGNARTRKMHYKLGKPSKSTYTYSTKYVYKTVSTYMGVLGIKVWIFH